MEVFMIRRAVVHEHAERATNRGETADVPAVTNLNAVRAMVVALDQITNRSDSDLRRWGHIDPGTAETNRTDLEYARRQVAILRAGVATGQSMIDHIEQQLDEHARPPVAEAVTEVAVESPTTDPAAGDEARKRKR
jgi:hypothetical protein